jgi:tetratricopeptide (TPR) repeat protein
MQVSSVKALARLGGRSGLQAEGVDAEPDGLRPAPRSDPGVLAREYASAAADYMREGEFYRAVSYYDIALTVDPKDGRLHLGEGHALLGAGEYFSALRRIERAFDLSPELARSGIDLNEVIGDAELLQRRRTGIETALQRREDYRFRFLLGYVEYYSGFEKAGRENLERAADAAPEDSFIARFPSLLETGGADIDIPPEMSPAGLPE